MSLLSVQSFLKKHFKKSLFKTFLIALDLCCCVPAFSSFGGGFSLTAVHRLLTVEASLVEEYRL